MDIRWEKIRLVEKILLLEDVQLIKKLKDLLNTPTNAASSNQLIQQELLARARKSNQAINDGKVKSVAQIMEEMKNW